MASNKVFRFGPATLAASAANILNPPTATGGVNAGSSAQYIVLKHIRIVNRTAGAVAYSLFVGATGGSAAGTEFMGSSRAIAANSFEDWYGVLRLDAADFLTGFASASNSLTIQGEGEIGVSG